MPLTDLKITLFAANSGNCKQINRNPFFLTGADYKKMNFPYSLPGTIA